MNHASSLPLQALQAIESVGDRQPFRIVVIAVREGTVMTAEELMTAKVRWACKAGYRVVTRTIPSLFAPYNAIIRVSEAGTEDSNRDYLAKIVD
jgi:hypothetical protein